MADERTGKIRISAMPSYEDIVENRMIWLPPDLVVEVRDDDGEIIAYGVYQNPDDDEDDDDGS